MTDVPISRIDELRTSARQIVREFGFMQTGLAGTDLSASAVHTIVEIGYGTVRHANALAALLHLEKSSVSRLLKKLETSGYIDIGTDEADKRSRVLSLTADGRKLLERIEIFARKQMGNAISRLSADEVGEVDKALRLFARALSQDATLKVENGQHREIIEGYRPGLIGSVSRLHAVFYSESFNFGQVFERKVATEMSEFMGRVDRPMNAVFSVFRGDELLGTVSIDGEDLGDREAHLRWFIVSPNAHGMGIGSKLAHRAMKFVDDYGFSSTRLWTFKGLDSARHIYETNGFALVRENPGTQWGTEVHEQEFARTRSQ